ncbi:class I SAM-dependent methyltransferase [Thermodesulfobacteriota bacterium]
MMEITQSEKPFQNRAYLKWTDYHLEIGGTRRINYIIDEIQRYYSYGIQSVNILDFGYGKGNISIPLAYLGYNITGIDIDKESIQLAKERNPFPNAELFQCSLYELGKDNLYDVIICSEVLEHIKKPEDTLNALKCILSRGGLLIITVPNGYSILESYWRLLTWLKSKKIGVILKRAKNVVLKSNTKGTIETANIDDYHVQHFSLKKMSELLASENLQIVKCENASSILMDIQYIFLKLFIKAGTPTFRALDRMDGFLARLSPYCFSTGWMLSVKYNTVSNQVID